MIAELLIGHEARVGAAATAASTALRRGKRARADASTAVDVAQVAAVGVAWRGVALKEHVVRQQESAEEGGLLLRRKIGVGREPVAHVSRG